MNLEDAGRIALANAQNSRMVMAVVRRRHRLGGYDVEFADTKAGEKDRVFVVGPKDTLELVLAQTTKKYQDVVGLIASVKKTRQFHVPRKSSCGSEKVARCEATDHSWARVPWKHHLDEREGQSHGGTFSGGGTSSRAVRESVLGIGLSSRGHGRPARGLAEREYVR